MVGHGNQVFVNAPREASGQGAYYGKIPTKITFFKSFQRLRGECVERTEPLVGLNLDFFEKGVNPPWPRPVSHGVGKIEHLRLVETHHLKNEQCRLRRYDREEGTHKSDAVSPYPWSPFKPLLQTWSSMHS